MSPAFPGAGSIHPAKAAAEGAISLSDDRAVTVADLLADLPGARVVAGHAGLQRSVRSVNILEIPAELERLREGDLLFAALPRPGLAAVVRLLPELHRRGLAGIALRPHLAGGGVERLPDQARESADRFSFPLLELHPEASYSDLLLPVMARLLDHQAYRLNRQSEIHRTMMRTILEGKGLGQAAAVLADLTGNPVCLCDALERPLATAAGPVPPILPDGWAHAEAISGEYVLALGDLLHRRERFRSGAREWSRVVTPVVVSGQTHGYIAVAEVTRLLCEDDLTAIGAATAVVALEMANERSAADVERRYRNEFLQALLSREVEAEVALERARLLGWDLSRPLVALALDVESTAGADDRGVRLGRDTLLSDLAAAGGEGLIAGRAGALMVALFSPPSGPERSEARREAIVMAQGLQARAARLGRQVTLSVGVGGCHQGVDGVRRSFQEARRALHVGRRVWGAGRIIHVDDLGVYQLLSVMRGSDELTQLLERIAPLVQYDAEHNTDLVQTLDHYFECKGNVRRVSERLFAHYNTVLYRLERIEQICGADLEDARDRLNLQVALQAHKLLGNQ